MENRVIVETTVPSDRNIKREVDYAHRRCHFPESLFPLIFIALLFALGLFLLLPMLDFFERMKGAVRLTAALSAPALFYGSYWFTRRRQLGRYWEQEDAVETTYLRYHTFTPLFLTISTVAFSMVKLILAAWFIIVIGIGLLVIYTFSHWRGPLKKQCTIVNAEYKSLYIFTEDKIVFSNQTKPSLPYTLIRYIAETDEHFILFENEVLAHVIPKDQIVEGSEEQLRWLLQAQAELVVTCVDTGSDYKKCKRLFFIATAAVSVVATLLTILF